MAFTLVCMLLGIPKQLFAIQDALIEHHCLLGICPSFAGVLTPSEQMSPLFLSNINSDDGELFICRFQDMTVSNLVHVASVDAGVSRRTICHFQQ